MATRSKRKRLGNLYDLLEAFPNESVCINHLERQRLAGPSRMPALWDGESCVSYRLEIQVYSLP